MVLTRDDHDLAYRDEVVLNVDKTDFGKKQPSHAPLLINNTAVKVVSSTKFLGVQTTSPGL